MITLKQVIRYPDTNSVEVTWVDEDAKTVKCHSYADVQMDILRADLGADVAEYEELIALVESNIKPVTPPTLSELIPQYEAVLDNYLDSVAQKYRFKNRENLSLRAGYPSAYQPLALAYAEWMDGCNVQAYQGLQDVIDKKRSLPAIEGFIAELPAFAFP